MIKKAKNTVPWTYVISNLEDKEIVARLYKKELTKTTQEYFRLEKVIKRKSDKLNVKLKDNNSSLTVGLITKI